MTQPFVAMYTDSIRQAFSKVLENEEFADQEKIVSSLVDKILVEVIDRLHYFVTEDMISNIGDTISAKAAEVAEHMLRDALAGDNQELRNLFGFNDWYMKHAFSASPLPKQWQLIDAIVKRNPQFFVDERLLQRDKEIALLKDNVQKLMKENQRLFEENAKVRGHY